MPPAGSLDAGGLERLLAGDRRALARAITRVDNEEPGWQELMAEVYPHGGKAFVVGVTGSPGAGKSTLVSRLAQRYRDAGQKVGVIAIDPSSPFSGGALLGDRVRMGRNLEGIFFRSLASRGHLGGLSRAAGDVIQLLDAAGYDPILVETVGAGQSEVEVMQHVQTTLVVLAPGMGDDVQASKAGILEIGDLFVVNKADREEAERTVAELEMMLDLNPNPGEWRPPVLKTVARDGDGIAELVEAIAAHRAYLERSGRLEERRVRQAEEKLRTLVGERLLARIWHPLKDNGELQKWVEAILRREIDPYSAADRILAGHCDPRAPEAPRPKEGDTP